MLILTSIPGGLKFGSVNHKSIYENSGLKVFKNIKFLIEIPNNWHTDLIWHNTLESRW